MATKSTSSVVRSFDEDRRASLAVGFVTLVALLLGLMLKSSVQNRSLQIDRKGISAAVPENWVMQDGAGDLIFVSWDPFEPGIRYSVYLISNDGNHPLEEVAAERNLALGKILDGFRILNETPVIRRGREGYKVTYAFIDTDTPGLPRVLQGVDYYFPENGQALIISLQAQEKDYADALVRFEPFLDSVKYQQGE